MTDEDSGRIGQLLLAPGGEEPVAAASPLRGQIALLLGEKRYEEALELLYAARWRTPDAPEISRGINLLKERLIRRYAGQLGTLDAVPSVAAGVDQSSLAIGDEERAVLRLIDGISSLADIAHQSRIGRFETYRALSRVVGDGLVVVGPPPALTPLPVPRGATTASPRALPVPAPRPSSRPFWRRWRPPLVAVATLTITAATGVAWWAIDRVAPPSHPAAAATSVPSGRTRRDEPIAPSPAAPLGAAPSRDERREPPAAAASAPPAPGVQTAFRRSSRSAGKSGGRSKGRLSQRGVPAFEAPASPRPLAAGAVTGPAVEEREAPSLPDLPDPAPTPGVRASLQATSSDNRSRPAPAELAHARREAPQSLVKASATSSFAPASVSVATSDIAVRGSLGRSVVEHAIARVQGDFRSCYGSASAALRRDAAGAARVSLTIDETGYAGAVSVQGGPLPGLDGCLQEVARRIRTRVPPDVGLAAVNFTIVFSVSGATR